MIINRTLLVLGAATTMALTASCGTDEPTRPDRPGAETPGSVVSTETVADLSHADVSARLRAAGIDAEEARHGVVAYRVVYRTVDTDGGPTTASQLVALPKNDESDLSVVSWLHGTTVYRGDVASMNEKSSDRAAALLFASTGLAVSAPDYLGLGEGPGSHPYGHPETTVSSVVDALRSARELAGREGRTFDERVRVSGFSQGGPATMMVGRALQEGVDPDFSLGGLATIAGPFDLSTFEADAADDKIEKSALYLAYFSTAWDRVYGLYDSPEQAFKEPYAAQVETLFDGDHPTAEIATALPPISKDLFTQEFLDKVRNPSGILARKLQVLDTTCDWRPDVPVHLFHASGDQDVEIEHSRHCQRQLDAHGAGHQLTDVGAVDHNTTVDLALPQVAREFSRA